METGFTFTKDSLDRISGNGKDDLGFAKRCVGQMLTFVEGKRRSVEEFGTYRKIATNSDLPGINDDLTAMDYVCSELRRSSEFFKLKSDMFAVFDGARQQAEKDFEVAKGVVAKVKGHIVAV